jgi:hypothetical protein
MNTQGRLGFVYDVTHFDPQGNEVERQHFHNVIPNEGLRLLLAKVFVPTAAAPAFTNATTYADFSEINLSFMTQLHTVNKTFDSAGVDDFGEAALNNNLQLQATNYSLQTSDSRFPYEVETIDTTQNMVTLRTTSYYEDGIGIYCITQPIVLTGVLLYFSANGYGKQFTSRDNCLLLSEALFPNPIQMEVKGKISVKCGCTVISA